MANKLFVLVGTLAFLLSIANAEQKNKPEIPKEPSNLKITGTCPMTKTPGDCSDADGTNHKYTYYEFEAKPSKNIKTIAKSCSSSMIAETLKLPEANVEALRISSLSEDSLNFKVESCTLLSHSPAATQLGFVILVQKDPPDPTVMNAPTYRKLVFVKTDGKDKPEQILKVVQSKDTTDDSVEVYAVENICDTDGDNTAEIVLRKKGYYTDYYEVIKVKPETNEVILGEWMASGGCGC